MRENKILEFKENIESNTFLKTVSAFANYCTGCIIFGICDDGTAKGVDNPVDACLRIENKINDNIRPAPTYTLTINDNDTITLEVCLGTFKPYFYKGKAYKRNDSSSIEVDRLELNRLILEGQNLSFEELVSSKQNLQFNVLEKELIETVEIKALNEDILKILNLYSSEGKFNNAAALLADENNYKGVDIVKFGNNMDEIMDRETFENVSIISLLKDTVDIYKKYYQYEKINDTVRTKVELIPEKAFREAIGNALIHRLWDNNLFIRISMYSDKIEITSPGGLPSGLSKEEYLDGQISLLRNTIIGNTFYRLKYIEKFGTGILRIKNAYINSLVKPEFKVYDNSITIVLPVISYGVDLTDEEKIIVNLLNNNMKLSRNQIESEVKFSKDKTIRVLNALIDKNIILKSGKARGVRYYLK